MIRRDDYRLFVVYPYLKPQHKPYSFMDKPKDLEHGICLNI